MIKNILLLLSLIIILANYIQLLILYLNNKNKKESNLTGFDLAKEISSNYDEINIVEANNITISKYNLRRNVLRLTPNSYNKTDLFTLAAISNLTGYSLLAMEKDQYLSNLSKIFKNIDNFNKSSLIALLISLFTNTITDAKLGIILLILILLYQYLRINITTNASDLTKERLNHINQNLSQKLEPILNYYLKQNTIYFVTTLILIIREITIIINL